MVEPEVQLVASPGSDRGEEEIQDCLLTVPKTTVVEVDSKFTDRDTTNGTAKNRSALETDKIFPSRRKKCCCCSIPDWFWLEFREVFNLSWSMTLLTLFNYMIGPVSLAFCGHLGTKTFAGVALGLMVTNVLGISVGAGLSSACGTFFSQSYGSTNKKMVGLYLIRSLLIILLFVLPCWALFLNTELLLVTLGQDAENARIADEFVVWWLPALPAVFTEEVMMQYLRCQNILTPTVIVGGVAQAFNALLHYIFLFVFELGVFGSALSQVVTFYLMAISLTIYILASGVYKDTWPGWTVDVFQEWGIFLKLAVQGFVMLALQWWSWEMAVILAGLFGDVELASQSIGLQVSSIAYTVPMGIALACQIRVGQLLGAEKSTQAWRSAKIGLGLAVMCGILLGTALASFSSVIPRAFSNDSVVIEYATNIVLMVGAYEFFDTMKGVTAGILNGCGRQGLGAVGLIVGYCLFGIPIGIVLMFLTHLEVIGMYVGFTLGLLVVGMIYLAVILRTDWTKQVEMAKVRACTNKAEEDKKMQLEPKDTDCTTPLGHHSPESNIVITGRFLSTSRVDLTNLTLYESVPLSGKQLVLRRGGFVLFMVSLLLAGLMIRLFVHIPDSRTWSELCRMENSTLGFNDTTLPPLCNYSTIYNSTAYTGFKNGG